MSALKKVASGIGVLLPLLAVGYILFFTIMIILSVFMSSNETSTETNKCVDYYVLPCTYLNNSTVEDEQGQKYDISRVHKTMQNKICNKVDGMTVSVIFYSDNNKIAQLEYVDYDICCRYYVNQSVQDRLFCYYDECGVFHIRIYE